MVSKIFAVFYIIFGMFSGFAIMQGLWSFASNSLVPAQIAQVLTTVFYFSVPFHAPFTLFTASKFLYLIVPVVMIWSAAEVLGDRMWAFIALIIVVITSLLIWLFNLFTGNMVHEYLLVQIGILIFYLVSLYFLINPKYRF